MTDAPPVNSWDILILALAHKKPARNRKWLQEKLGVTTQTLTNWKAAGEVPPGRYMEVCDLVELTAEQLTGRAPLPWSDEGWPFESVNQAEYRNLMPAQRQKIEDKVREMVEGFRPPKKGDSSGGSSSHSPEDRRHYGT